MSEFPIRFGRYDLLDLLSSGGMAEVYLARSISEDPRNRRAVAIKRVLPFLSKDADFIKLFEREIGLTFQMTHPNLVKVYESGYIDGQYFIAMEHVLGKTLTGFVANPDSMKELRETPFALYIVREVCKALSYAHNYRDPVTNQPFGITHRDISPHNILISYTGQVKLFDFGVAKGLMKEGSTTAGVLKGKPAYVSPEQVLGKPVDLRTDIFSLGVVLWELLAGRRLFFHENPLISIRNVVEMDVPPPSTFDPNAATFDAVVLKALAKDPKNRYFCAADFMADIDKAVAGKFKEFGDAHFTWMMRYFFEHELKAAQEELDYKLRLSASTRQKEPASKKIIVPPSVSPIPAKILKSGPVPPLPVMPATSSPKIVNDSVFDGGMKSVLNANLSHVYTDEIAPVFSRRPKAWLGALAALMFALGALGHFAVSHYFGDDLQRSPASTGDCRPVN